MCRVGTRRLGTSAGALNHNWLERASYQARVVLRNDLINGLTEAYIWLCVPVCVYLCTFIHIYVYICRYKLPRKGKDDVFFRRTLVLAGWPLALPFNRRPFAKFQFHVLGEQPSWSTVVRVTIATAVCVDAYSYMFIFERVCKIEMFWSSLLWQKMDIYRISLTYKRSQCFNTKH